MIDSPDPNSSKSGRVDDRTIWYGVFDAHDKTNEPFAVLRANLLERKDGGVVATVISYHWTREDAEAAAHRLNGGTVS